MASSSAIFNLVPRVLVSQLLDKRNLDSGNKIVAILGNWKAHVYLIPLALIAFDIWMSLALAFASHMWSSLYSLTSLDYSYLVWCIKRKLLCTSYPSLSEQAIPFPCCFFFSPRQYYLRFCKCCHFLGGILNSKIGLKKGTGLTVSTSISCTMSLHSKQGGRKTSFLKHKDKLRIIHKLGTGSTFLNRREIKDII